MCDLARTMNLSIEWVQTEFYGSGAVNESGSMFNAIYEGKADITSTNVDNNFLKTCCKLKQVYPRENCRWSESENQVSNLCDVRNANNCNFLW